MLRYNNSTTLAATKPVDYYRPLTVDVSVEYELPKEVAPPKGSAPLLIIHPSAYFRPKPNTAASSSPAKQSHHQLTPPRNNPPGGSVLPQSQQRLGDIASTLYYLSTNGLPPPPSNSTSSPPQHITSSSRSTHHRGGASMADSSSRVTRSRAAAKAQNCDDYRTRLSNLSAAAAQSMKFTESRGGGGVIKKVAHSHQPANQFLQNHLDGSGGGGGYGPVPMDSSVSIATPSGLALFSQGQQAAPQQSTTARSTTNNKRLRMMNQQQQQQQQVTALTTMYGPSNNINLSAGGLVMEPLNLALTPTHSSAVPYNNQQFSTFLGYSGLQSVLPGRVGTSPSTLTGSTNQVYQPQHMTSFQQNQFLANAYVQQQQRHLGNVGMLKEGHPVPVDKGSGSDSGVCSENDSDDVSPPMAAAPFSNTNTTTSQMSRRSNLSGSQEFPGAGCYCCCCPSTSTYSGRKTSKVTAKGHMNQIQPTPQAAPTPAFPTGLSNYGNFFNVIQQQQHQLLGGGAETTGSVQPHGGSPMDSSAPPPQPHHHHHQQQRKWLGSVSTTLLSDGLTFPTGPQVSSTYGKRYQV